MFIEANYVTDNQLHELYKFYQSNNKINYTYDEKTETYEFRTGTKWTSELMIGDHFKWRGNILYYIVPHNIDFFDNNELLNCIEQNFPILNEYLLIENNYLCKLGHARKIYSNYVEGETKLNSQDYMYKENVQNILILLYLIRKVMLHNHLMQYDDRFLVDQELRKFFTNIILPNNMNMYHIIELLSETTIYNSIDLGPNLIITNDDKHIIKKTNEGKFVGVIYDLMNSHISTNKIQKVLQEVP